MLLLRHCKRNNRSLSCFGKILSKMCDFHYDTDSYLKTMILYELLKIIRICGNPRFDSFYLICEADPKNVWKYVNVRRMNEELPQTDRFIRVCVSILKLTETKDIPGLIVPARYKNKLFQ